MQSWLEGRIWVGKGAQATGMTASLRAKLIQTLVRASQGVDWSWSQCIKSHHAQTSSGKGLPSHFWTRDNVRSILPGLWRKELSGPKSSFQMKVNFAFHLEIKVPESGGRVERHRIHVAWSPVWSFHSQWWFGCHVICWCWSTVFSEVQSMQPSTRKFYSTSCFLLLTSFMEMLISFSSRTWHLPTLPKVPKAGSMTMVLVCLIGQQTHQTRTRGRWETPDPTMQMSWRPLSKKPGLPYHLSSATNWSPPCHAELRQ